jgi:hypothetical protein
MPIYDVVIRATVTKTIRVEAIHKDHAAEEAHEQFTTECDGGDENYEEECLDITEVKKSLT